MELGFFKKSYWYASVSLIRQTQLDNWHSCFQDALKEIKASKSNGNNAVEVKWLHLT